jgi:uncharacterized protein
MIKEEILKIVKSQQITNEKTLPRELKLDKTKLIKIITGIRRCGKSTLLKQLKKKNDLFINFEDPRLSKFQTEDFVKIINVSNTFFFDEIQNVSEWERGVRYLHDQNKNIYISGSNAQLLSKELGTKLTGRHISYELFPFSQKEYKKYTKRNSYLNEGGFPEYLKSKNSEYLRNLLIDILNKDIILRYNIREKKELVELTTYLLSNISKEISYNKLSKLFELSVTTISNFIKYLNDAYIIFTLQKFSFSIKKQIINPKKIYCIDNGLLKANSLSFTKDKGRLLENAVFLKLKRKYKEIFYFKDKYECDFIIKDRDSLKMAVQVCYNLNSENMKRELNGFKNIPKEIKKKIIVTNNQKDKMDGIEIIPFDDFDVL